MYETFRSTNYKNSNKYCNNKLIITVKTVFEFIDKVTAFSIIRMRKISHKIQVIKHWLNICTVHHSHSLSHSLSHAPLSVSAVYMHTVHTLHTYCLYRFVIRFWCSEICLMGSNVGSIGNRRVFFAGSMDCSFPFSNLPHDLTLLVHICSSRTHTDTHTPRHTHARF